MSTVARWTYSIQEIVLEPVYFSKDIKNLISNIESILQNAIYYQHRHN